MPASKRSSESHSPQAKMMKLEEDEEATPGANNSSHKTEDAHEGTVPPWTKKKDPPTAKEDDEEVASILHEAKPSPCQNDSDPPLKKAKLFIATSASSGTSSPQSAEFKASQKRPASTELSRTASSDSDGELSSEDSLFTRTDAGDASRCTKHHNRAKRAATELLVDQSATSQTPDDDRPLYPTETDHNYGRASEESSDGSVVNETANTETKEVNVSSVTGAETTECVNSASLSSLQATPYSVIQSTHPAAEARRHEGEEPTRPTAEAGSSTGHVQSRPSEKHEGHETELSSERTSREPGSQNHVDVKIVESPPPAETSDPSSSDINLFLTTEVNLSESQERTGGFAEPEAILDPCAEPRAKENHDLAPEEQKPDMMHKREAEQLMQQDVTEPTGVTEASNMAVLESGPASNQTNITNYCQQQVLAGPSEGSLTTAKNQGLSEGEDEAQLKTLVTLERTSTAGLVLPHLVEPCREETAGLLAGSVVHPMAESVESPSGVQADLGVGNMVAEESIAAPESSAEVQQVHDFQEPDDSTVSSSTEVVVTNSEEHLGRTVYECVTVQEPEITSNLDSTTSSQGMCDVVPAEDTQPEVMQNVHTSTSTSSGVSAQATVTNPDSRTEYDCVSECLTIQDTPNLVSTTTDPLPTEETESDGTQHLDVTPGTCSDSPELLPDTESEVVSEYVAEGEVHPQVNLSSSTAILKEEPDLVSTEASIEEEVSLKVYGDSTAPGLSSHGLEHMVVRPLISEAQYNVNLESTSTLVVSSTMPTDCITHYKEASTDLSISTPVSSANDENEVVSECVAETSLNMDSTATDEQKPGQAQIISDGVRYSETHSADHSSLGTRAPQHVMITADSKEEKTVISDYVPEQNTDMNTTTSEMCVTAPIDDLEDEEIQRINNDTIGMSSEATNHPTLSTPDCVGDQDTAPYMEMTETKPDLLIEAQENENPDREEQAMGQSTATYEDGASQLISTNLEPRETSVQTPQIAAMSMTAPLQKASPPVQEMQTQKDDMPADTHVLNMNCHMNQNEDKTYECHAVHGGQTDIKAKSHTMSAVMDEEKENSNINPSHEVLTHPLIITSESAVNEYVITSECGAAAEAESTDNMHVNRTPEEMHNQEKNEHGGDQGNHSGTKHAPTQEWEKKGYMFDKMEAELHTATSDDVPNFIPAGEQQIQVIHEEPIAVVNDAEEGCLTSNAEFMNKDTIMEAVAYVPSGDQENEDEMPSMEEKSHSVLEDDKHEGSGRGTDEVEVNASLSSTTGQCEAQVNSEVIVFVCGQPEELVVVESSTVNKPDGEDVSELMESGIQSEGEAKDFQVVYEAISSPESTMDEEVSVVPEVPGSILLPNTQKRETQEMEGDTAAISTTSEVNVPTSPTQEADEQINGRTPACLPDSQSGMDIETMTCEVTAGSLDVLPMEHTNGAVDAGDVLVVATSDEVPEPNIQKTEAMADVVEEPTSFDVLDPNIQKTRVIADTLDETTTDDIQEQTSQNTEEKREVLVVTTSDEVPKHNIQNTEERREVLVVTTSDEVPKQNIQNTEERREVLVVTTSDRVPEPSFPTTKETGEVLVVSTIDHIPQQNIQNTEETGEVPIVTTSGEVPEQNIQRTEDIVDVLVETTNNHIPEQSIQKTVKVADALVVATSQKIPEGDIQKTEVMGDVLVVTTCDNVPELTMQQTEGMGDVLVVATRDTIPEPAIQQMEGIGDEKEEVIEEANRAPASVEMQKDNRLQEPSQVTQISTAMASSETPDGLSQEEVMESLTVPESADHTDIITQAAAASGLTTSLSEHLNSDGQMVEADQVLNLNGTSQSFYSAIGVQQYQGMEQSTMTSSNEEATEEMEGTDAGSVALNYIPPVPNADQKEEQSAEKNQDSTEHDMENLAVSEPQMQTYENASVDMTKSIEVNSENAEGDMQILVDIELGHQVEVQDESEMDDPDLVIIEKSHSAAEMPPVEVENGAEKSPTNNAESTTSNADSNSQKAEETTKKTTTPSVTTDPKAEVTVEKPKKQQMNTQARTKARLAALAEQKAAASKRAAQRQQLNLLALCEEIAEDIATDSMLLKRIEEEKIAAAAKIEAMKKESPPVDIQEATSVPPTPAGPQASSPPVNATEKALSAKPTTTTTTATNTTTTTNPTAEPAQAKPVAPEPPKRRFFVSQIVVPLKAHEKKKLTRYQRLRQVELQREKMSWTRVKKLKTDQAHQMLFSDIDFDSSNPFLMPVATPSTPVANKPTAADTSTASTSTSTTSALPATPQASDAAVSKPDQSKTPDPSKVVTTPEPSKAVSTQDPSKAVTTPDPSKAVTTPDPSKEVATSDPSKVVATPDQSKVVATPDPSKASTTKPDQKETPTPRPGRPRREAATSKVDPAKVASSKVEPRKTEPPKVTPAKGPTPKATRSSTRKTLPAKPPPMPNGMNSQKAKSEVEYKPYRPRPKYSIEDFELDDDPVPVVQRRPMPQTRPGQQPGPSQQSTSTTQVRPMFQSTNPTAQSRPTPPSKPMVSLAGQTKLKLQGTPARQVSSQSKPATSTPVMLKPATSSTVQSRPAISSTVQSKPVTTTASQSKSVASTTSQSKPTTSATGQLKPTTSNASQSKPVTPTVQSKPIASKAPQPKPFAPSISQPKPSVTAAPQPKATIAAPAHPISAVPCKPTLKSQNQVSDSVDSLPDKVIASGPPAPKTGTAGPAAPQPKDNQAPEPQPGSLEEKVEVKPAMETPAVTPADPQPMETQSVQPPTTPHTVKCQDSNEVSPAPSTLLLPKDLQTSSDRTETTEEKPEVKSQPPSPMKASPPEEPVEESKPAEKTPAQPSEHRVGKMESNITPLSEASLQKEVKKLKDADKDGSQTIIDAGQKHFGAVACSVCGMLYSASNPEDETQHLLFHNQFISAVKYVGWKKERILGEYPDGKIILVLPDDPKYALKKVEEIREMVDNDLGFQQVETKCPSQTKTFLFISNDKKVAGCLIAEHIQEGYRVIEDPAPEGSEREQVMFERQRAWCCSSTSEPAICGISRIWVFSMMRRQGIASRMIESLRNNFIYGSCLGKDELAFSDPTPDGKLFATRYFGTSRFLVYNFVSGTRPSEPKTTTV